MISLLIILTLIIALVASLGYTVYSFQRSNDLISLAQRNAAQMDGIAAALKGALRVVEQDGPVRAPLGDVVSGRSVLPGWVIGNDRTPWGGRYGWCPYSTAKLALSETGESIGSGATATYQAVSIVDRGRAFVLRSSAPAANEALQSPAFGIVGFIVSPAPYKSQISEIPDCGDVRLVDGVYLIKGDGTPRVPGSVVPVIARGPQAAAGTATGTLLLYASPDGASGITAVAQGLPAPGDAPGTPLNISTAVAALKSTGYKTAVLSLAGGNYPIPASAFDIPGLSLEVVATDASTPPTFTSGGVARVSADTIIRNVNFGPDAGLWTLPGSRLRVFGGSIAYLRNDGGETSFENTKISGSPARDNALELTGGRISLSGTIEIGSNNAAGYGAYASGGELVLGNATLTLTGNGIGPWLLFNQARLSVAGPSTLNGSPVLSSATVTETCAEGGTSAACVATCPALLYPVSASCSAGADIPESPGSETAAQLRSSTRVGNEGWSCAWNPARTYAIQNNGVIVDGTMAEVPVPMAPGGLVETVHPLPKRQITLHCLPTLQ